MTIHEEPEGGGAPALAPIVEPIPLSLIDAPLDYIFADHFRQRIICAALKRLAETGRARRVEADMVTGYLDRDLALHHEDEDVDLFPALRRRALAEDNLGPVLARLSEDHRQSEVMVSAILDALAARLAQDPVKLDSGARRVMQAYAASEHRHLAMENGIVMAIARIRLKPADLKAISHGMRQRRGALS